MRLTCLCIAMLLVGCRITRDVDGDGFHSSEDCDDANAEVAPDMPEVCNGADDDCDGEVDEDAIDRAVFYGDVDGDGFGDLALAMFGCDMPADHVADGTDCDDGDASIFPGAPEDDCTDPVDRDCDGVPALRDNDGDGYARCEDCDDADPDRNPETIWFEDADGDGVGSAVTVADCEPPSGHVAVSGDCDDADPAVLPGRDEICNDVDDDCNGMIDDVTEAFAAEWFADLDGDGFGAGEGVVGCPVEGWVNDASDCDDQRATVYPGAEERCDGRDSDCDGLVDEDAVDARTWHADLDGDGFGDLANTVSACVVPSGYTGDVTDCDDAQPTVYPRAEELCDALDNDCDGEVDEAGDQPWYRDADGDGLGDPDVFVIGGCEPPAGHVTNADDCDDSDAGIGTGLPFHVDADLDGFGDPDVVVSACERPPNHTTPARATDCDDTADTVFPGAAEVCNGIDDDCDDQIDEDVTEATEWHLDADGDGFGGPTVVPSCEAPPGHVLDGTDCDDDDDSVFPGAQETCNGRDDDCDGEVDEDGESTWYADSDRDGFGDPSSPLSSCGPPPDHVDNGDDCDDSDRFVNPDATEEIADGIDSDCDGLESCYLDNDRDDWRAGTDFVVITIPSPNLACDGPGEAGRDSQPGDCDDSDPFVNPDADEVQCDGVDQDCDGEDACEACAGFDSDGDGVDNCIDPDVYDERFDDVNSFADLGWSVVEFAAMECCFDIEALDMPVAPPPFPDNPPEWQIDGEMLFELTNASHSAAVSFDHGPLDDYVLTTDIAPAGFQNDGAGVVFDFVSVDQYKLVRWDNPDGSYERWGSMSSLEVIECRGGACEVLDTTFGGVEILAPLVFAELRIEIDGGDGIVFLDGVERLEFSVDSWGPGRIGVYSFDADSGVFYDRIAISR